jgi:MFS transporter, FHS family, glucose/mannose:H+ symporter
MPTSAPRMDPSSSTPTGDAGLARIRLAVVLVYMVFGALLNSVGAVILLAVQTLGVQRADAALLDAFKDLPIAIVSFFVAAALPRLGLRRAMLLALAFVTLGCLVAPLLAQFWALKLLFVLIGGSFALVKVAAYATVGLVTRDERAHAGFMSLMEGLFMVGVLGGYVLFSVATRGAAAESTQWLLAYWALGAVAALAFVLVLISPLDETPVRPRAAADAGSTLAGDFLAMWRLLLAGGVVVFLLSASLYVLIEQGISTWLPTFNREVRKMPTDMSVGLAVLMPASTALGRLLAAPVVMRLGWYRVVNLCLVGVAVLIVATMPLAEGIVPDPAMSWGRAPLVAWVIPLLGLLLAPIYPAIVSAMLSALPKPQHAAMTGLIVVFSALGGSAGSFITGRLFVAFDGPTAFRLLLVPTALLLLTLAVFRRRQAATAP